MYKIIIKRIAVLFTGTLFVFSSTLSQSPSYKDSIEEFVKEYKNSHEVVKGKDRDYISFYPANEKYRVNCRFEKIDNSPWFQMQTSGLIKKTYRVYGKIHFSIDNTEINLNVYQSQDLMLVKQYANLLFIPFTDATTGTETYDSGRYIDITMDDINDNKVVIDFNRAYNPYCAYVTGIYNCPLPPPENNISIAIRAGEKAYGKPH